MTIGSGEKKSLSAFTTDRDQRLVIVGVDTGDPGGTGPLASDRTLGYRFSGGKSAVCTTVTASGDTTILTPASGNAITVWWITAINDPDEATSPLIKVLLGSTEIYRAYALAHWEPFTGATNDVLKINLSGAASVAVTVHYTET